MRIILHIYSVYQTIYFLSNNFFLPQTKLIDKHRDGAHIRKRYEIPMTPYRKALQSEGVTDEDKGKLKKLYDILNPAELKRGMMSLQERLTKLRIVH
jgi:hypothetical protein